MCYIVVFFLKLIWITIFLPSIEEFFARHLLFFGSMYDTSISQIIQNYQSEMKYYWFSCSIIFVCITKRFDWLKFREISELEVF